MSTPQQASPTDQVRLPSTPDPEKQPPPPPTTPSPDDEATKYKCTCGTPDASEDWIWCDSGTCPVGWYHWECALVTEAPPSGKWLCSKCRPRPRPRPSSSSGKKARTPKKGGKSRASMFVRTPGKMVSAAGRAGGGKSIDTADLQDNQEETKDKKKPRPTKKGIAIKKSTPRKKATSKWVEMTSENENEEVDDDEKGHEHEHEHKNNGNGDEDDAAAAVAAQRRRTMRSMVRATQPRVRKEGKELRLRRSRGGS